MMWSAVALALWYVLVLSESSSGLRFPSQMVSSVDMSRQRPYIGYRRHPHFNWREEPSAFSEQQDAYIDLGPQQLYPEEELDEPSGAVEYEDLAPYEQPARRLYDVLFKETGGYEDVAPEEESWYDDGAASREKSALDELLGELSSRVRYVDDNAVANDDSNTYGYEIEEEEAAPDYDSSNNNYEESSDTAVQQLRDLAKKSAPMAPHHGVELTPSPASTSEASSTSAPPLHYVQKGQKEVALLRPPTQSRPGMAPLEDQLTALRRARGGSYEVLRQLIAKEKRQEKEHESATSKHLQQKRFVTSEDNLTQELHTLKKTQA